MNGIIIKAISGFYYVLCDRTVYECKARGSFRKAEVSPLVGDNIEFSLTDSNHGVVEKIKNRRNSLDRPPIANIDKLFIVSSYENPAPDTLMVDRLSAIAVYHDIEPIIVFNKSDMGDFSKFVEIYKNTPFKTFVVSAKTNENIEMLKNETKNCISAFTGNSGVGKSSILNALFPDLNLKTNEVSEKLGRGKHTTRHTEIFPIDKTSFVADTPGFSCLEENKKNLDFKENLANCFPEFKDFLGFCKFSTCTHTCEKGCEILNQVDMGNINISRHNSYKYIFNELKDLKHWNT